MLSNAYFLAKFRFDTAENEPAKNLQNFRQMHFRKMHFSSLEKKDTAPVYSFGLSDPLRESADIKLQETEKEERRLGRTLTKEEAHTFPPAWKDDSRAHPGIIMEATELIN